MEIVNIIFKPIFSCSLKELHYTCNLQEPILNKFKESAQKFNKYLSELTFLCNGVKIDFSKVFKFEDLLKKSIHKNLINVLVTENQPPDSKINMMISEDYVREWGFKEGIREFLQNQHDGIISYALKEEDLLIKGFGEKYKNNNNSEDFKKFLNYEFFNRNNNEKLGEIIYDENKQILTITNKGELTLENLYFGSKKKNSNEIIGKFGEGMKLGILSLLRSEKDINIISFNRNFRFELCEGNYSEEEENKSKILHCIYSKYKANEMKKEVKVMIRNISKNEWNDEIFKYLWLLEKENFEIYVAEKYGEKIGEVLAEPIFENKLYNKGIYVQEIEKKKKDDLKSQKIPGFNINNLKLDRDRKCVQNTYDMHEQLAEIISFALKTNKRYSNYNSPKIEKKNNNKTSELVNLSNDIKDDKIDDKVVYIEDYGNKYLSEKLISLLNDENISFSQDFFFNYKLNSLNKDNLEKIWRTWEKMNGIEHRNPPKYQPVDFGTIKQLGNFLEKNKLDNNFYLYFEVKKRLMELLKNSSLYLGYEEKFEKYKSICQKVEKTNEVKNFLNDLDEKLKIPNFNKDFIEFKKFGNDIYFYDDKEKKLFFSYSKMIELDNICTKYWMFVIILKTLNIKIENSYYLFKDFFTYIK